MMSDVSLVQYVGVWIGSKDSLKVTRIWFQSQIDAIVQIDAT